MAEFQEEKESLMKVLIEAETPLNAQLSAKYKRSFAYPSTRDRAPVVLTKIVDYLVRDKTEIEKTYGAESIDEVKCAIGEFSQLKNRLQTSKPFELFTSSDPDTELWNKHLRSREANNETNNYYESDWLFAECYLYRRIREIFATKSLINSIDPFSVQKKELLRSALETIKPLFHYIHESKIMDKENVLSITSIKSEMIRLLKWSLWANRSDLSFKAGQNDEKDESYVDIEKWDCNIVADDSSQVIELLTSHENSSKTIDIVMDNGGLEMLSDMVLGDFLISRCGVKQVNFHIKPIPWYVSDVTKHDFMHGVDSVYNSASCKDIGSRWKLFLEKGLWTLNSDSYWCLGLPYHSMKNEDPSLYSRLSKSSLIIFKGDLNYRKLVRDINWEPSTPFSKVLDVFRPAPILAIRTLKADTVCGIEKRKVDELRKKEPDWWTSGNYGLIQFCPM